MTSIDSEYTINENKGEGAKSITADPEKTKDMLADAGVNTDFSGVDLETASACVDTLNEVFGNVQE